MIIATSLFTSFSLSSRWFSCVWTFYIISWAFLIFFKVGTNLLTKIFHFMKLFILTLNTRYTYLRCNRNIRYFRSFLSRISFRLNFFLNWIKSLFEIITWELHMKLGFLDFFLSWCLTWSTGGLCILGLGLDFFLFLFDFDKGFRYFHDVEDLGFVLLLYLLNFMIHFCLKILYLFLDIIFIHGSKLSRNLIN